MLTDIVCETPDVDQIYWLYNPASSVDVSPSQIGEFALIVGVGFKF